MESECFFELMGGGLGFIKDRDGEQIFNEVARDLLIEELRGRLPKSQRGLLKELITERHEEELKIDAYLKRRARPKAIAA